LKLSKQSIENQDQFIKREKEWWVVNSPSHSGYVLH